MIGHHDSGTGGLRHRDGSESPVEWVGMTSVPSSPTAASKAAITAWGPPATHPSADIDVCTNKVMSSATPSDRRSRIRVRDVAG